MSQPPPSRDAHGDPPLEHAAAPSLGRPVRRRFAVPLLLAAGLALAVAFVLLHDDVQYYRVTSGSMEPTLSVGRRVMVESELPLSVGEIVVFHAPEGAMPITPVCGATGEGAGFNQPCGIAVAQPSDAVLIKRIVAGPGDLVSIDAGMAVVNGITNPEPFVAPCASPPECSFPTPVRVPPGQYFVLGDNRAVSDDSRFWGPVPAGRILGVVVSCAPLQTACRPLR